MKKSEVLNLEGQFTWLWNDKFFIETPTGCYIWSDPQYNGNNTLMEYKGTYADFLAEVKVDYGRDKGVHLIKNYCGEAVRLISASHH